MREPLPAGELARAIRAFVPHAGAPARVLARAHIADGAVFWVRDLTANTLPARI
jgi:hypothetical protein